MLNIVMKIPPILDRRVVQSASKLYARVGYHSVILQPRFATNWRKKANTQHRV